MRDKPVKTQFPIIFFPADIRNLMMSGANRAKQLNETYGSRLSLGDSFQVSARTQAGQEVIQKKSNPGS